VFVNWPVIHTNDLLAAAAALCALDQGPQVYWDFHNALFDLTDEQFSRYSHYQRFTSLAESIENLDSAQFATCMVDDKYQAFVFELVQAGMELHLSGTPTFFVNGKMTYVDDLESIIESAINHRHP
jgi:protein-disulfide isomerase